MTVRVLHLRDSPWIDGPGRTILETGAHVDPARVDFHVAAFAANETVTHPLVAGARARGLKAHQIMDRGGVDQATIARIIELIHEHKIDVLHTSELRSNLYGYKVVRAGCKVKLVRTAHGWIANDLKRRVMRFVDKLLLTRADAVIAVSDATKALMPFWMRHRVLVLRNALMLDRYGADVVNAPRPRLEPGQPIVLANVGRLSAEKGQSLLIEAVAALSRSYPHLKLLIAGVGSLEAELKALATALGIGDRVVFTGFIDDMPALYKDVHLVVQSSFTEGLPNVILEAAYLRVPILATDVGGTAEVVGPGGALLIPPHSLDALTRGIRNFLEQPGKFAAMAERAHSRVLDEFAFDLRTERLTRFYENLVRNAVA
jgi:glycosyltransferase involved in cell wall biosynthesis